MFDDNFRDFFSQFIHSKNGIDLPSDKLILSYVLHTCLLQIHHESFMQRIVGANTFRARGNTLLALTLASCL